MEYCDVTMKTRTKLYRNIGVHTKPLKWSKHSQQRKLWVFFTIHGQRNALLSWKRVLRSSCSYFTFRSHFHFLFSFGTRTAHQEKIKPIYECIRTSNLPDLMYAQIINILSCLLLCCIFEVSKNHDQNESCDIRQLYVVELAVVMIPSKIIVISDQYWAQVVIERV